MKRTCEIILITALIAITTGLPSGEPNVEQSVASTPTFAEIITQAQAGINNLGRELQEKLNLPDQETVVNSIKNQSTSLVANIQSYIEDVSKNLNTKNPELVKTWNDIKDKLNTVVDDINTQIPKATEQASELQAKFTNGLNVLVEESDKAIKTIGQNSEKIKEDVAKFTKQAVDIAVQTVQNLDSQLRTLAVTEAPK